MFEKVTKTNSFLLIKILGWLQIIGGLFGIGLMGKLMLQTGTINGALLLIFLLGVSLFIFSIHTGKKLLLDADKKQGIIISIVNQSLQIVQFNLLGYGFSYSSCILISVGIKGTFFSFNFEAALATFQMSIGTDDPSFIRVNIVAILLIALLANILKAIKPTSNSQAEITEPTKSEDTLHAIE